MTKRIIYTNQDGGVSVVIPAPNSKLTIEELAAKDVPDDFEVFDVPTGVFEADPDTGEQVEVMGGRVHEHAAEIVETATIPSERMFRNAWEKSGNAVVTNIPKAKLLAHDMRRFARDEEMKPLDILATIPSKAAKAEADRVLVRAKYDTLQTNINVAVNEPALIQIVNSF